MIYIKTPFRHLMFDITLPRIAMFRDAVVDLMEVELGDLWSEEKHTGWTAMMNYCGGAMIYIKTHYSDQLRIIRESWGIVTRKCAASDSSQQDGGAAENGGETTMTNNKNKAKDTNKTNGTNAAT